MLSVLSCRHCWTLITLSCNFARKRALKFSISFSLNLQGPFSSKPLLALPKQKFTYGTMSDSLPSAFDILMSNASRKNQNSSQTQKEKRQSSPRKRKAPAENSQTPDLNPNNSPTQSERTVKQERSSLKDSNSAQINDARSKNSVENDEKATVDSSSVENSNRERIIVQESSSKQNVARNIDLNEDLGLAKKAKVSISPDESIVELKKKATSFDAKRAAYWGKGERVPFMFVAKTFDAISKESGRILITEIVCNMLRTVIEMTPDDLAAVVYLLANRIAPAHEGLELGIGDSSIIKALAEACGTKEVHIKKQYKELGDLGLVAKASRSSQPLMRKPEALTVAKVFDTFRLIAKESGKDSQEKKKTHIKGLLVAATDCEPQYLIRLLQTKLRIGLAEQTLLAALGHAAVYSEQQSSPPANVDNPLEEAAQIVKQVYSVIPVYDKIVPALLAGGVWNLPKSCSFSPGIPVGPMLAKPTKGVSEIVDKFQDMEFTCEYKYDGERAQIHYMGNGAVEIYSRNAERNTGKFPDVVAAVTRLKKPSVMSFVLDCELVAYDREKQKILPFQVLSTRARKNVVMSEIKVDVCIFAFDILYLNGQELLQEQLDIRREHLYKSFQEEQGLFQFATAITSNDLEEIQKFLDGAVDSSCEGLIIKTLSKDATYEPSKRSHNWLKLKKDYMESIGDSLDLVPIAAYHGRGKRTGVYGAFLLACYDSNKEEFQSICKIGTGFSEAMLEERSASLRSKVIPKPKSYYRYSDSINPDVWFEPTEVWEVKAADLTISPVHRAATGIVDSDKGISLRFPRLLRIREDKSPEQASSSDVVAEMYTAQKHNQRENQDENDDD
ncbi:DNA ligase 1 [Olea europaea subsp. europaea]|uniref:DNA ligase n=1 Tax=Olea europaea subsp. europaea TaxID=158383 RepID=A0A8S0SW80_OLEEU|nr:DNA ligase 1 [Olea europaea subsp. europaea]